MNINWSNTAAVAGVVIAIGSAILSYIAYTNANKQFTVINQSYLQVEPKMGFNLPNHDAFIPNPQVNDSTLFQGITLYLSLTNIGNIPLKYRVVRFDNEIGGRSITQDLPEQTSTGILYPKQTLDFNLKTLDLDDNGQKIPLGVLKKTTISSSIQIEYNDIGTQHKKYYDRGLYWTVHDNIIGHHYTRWDDAI